MNTCIFCPVCYNDCIEENFYITDCNHKFCNICLNKLDKCPFCRKSINKKNKINNTTEITNDNYLDILISILESDESKNLTLSSELINIVKFILDSEDIMTVLMTSSHRLLYCFKNVYLYCIVQNRSYFKNYPDKYEDFALAWLHYLYH